MELPEGKQEQITTDFVVSLPRTTSRDPKSIISDRDGRYIPQLWKNVYTILGSKLKFDTDFHPKLVTNQKELP